jgi:hypothetical protein
MVGDTNTARPRPDPTLTQFRWFKIVEARGWYTNNNNDCEVRMYASREDTRAAPAGVEEAPV